MENKITMKEAKKLAKQAPKFVMHSDEFGYDIYIGKLDEKLNPTITDKIYDATKWDDGFDNSKLSFHRALTGYNLQVKFI